MFRERVRTLRAVSVALDVVCIAVAFGVAVVLRVYHNHLPLLHNIDVIPWTSDNLVRSDYAALMAVSTVAWIASLKAFGVYEAPRSKGVATIVSAYARALVLAAFATAAANFILKMGTVSRIFFAYYFALTVILLIGKHLAVIAFLGRARQGRGSVRHALVVGAGKPAFSFAKVIKESGGGGYDLLGILLTRKRLSREMTEIPVLGTTGDIDTVLSHHDVDEVFIVGGASDLAGLAPLAQSLIERGRLVSLVTAMESGEYGISGRVTEFSGVPMLSFGPMPRDEINDGLKRSVDIAVAGLAGILALPVCLAVVAAIKVLDPGPVFFKQARLGRGGRSFPVYKFRTMRIDAEARLKADPELHARYVANDYKLPPGEDPRITWLGNFLRRTSLDELPQLWNVLRGDMALVGPRPIVPAELEKYSPYGEVFLSVRPGLTGLWQVSGRSSVSYPERAFLDLDYVARYDVFRDLRLIARTLPAVVQRSGAH